MSDKNEKPLSPEELQTILSNLVDKGLISMTWENGQISYFMTDDQKKFHDENQDLLDKLL